MKESYAESLANYSGPESCAGTREGEGEALTGVRVGWVLSRETTTRCESAGTDRGAEVLGSHRRQHCVRRHGKEHVDLARSEAPCMRGNILHGNREIPRHLLSRLGKSLGAARIVKPVGVRR